MTMRLFLILVLGLILAPAHAFATQADAPSEPPAPSPLLMTGQALSVDLDSTTISLTLQTERPESGVPIAFLIETTGETDQILEISADGEESAPFEILDVRRDAASSLTDSDRMPVRLELRTFDAGRLELPPVMIRLGTATATFPERSIEVASVAGLDSGPENFRDISDAVKVQAPIDWWFISMVLAGSLTMIVALAVLWWWSRRPGSTPPSEPADRWALGALERLASRRLPHAGEIEPFFTELTDIARAFIERRFRIAAPERTTQEFIKEARDHAELTDDLAHRLASLLRAADLVKFAGDRPMVAECDQALEVTRGFVIEAGPLIEETESPEHDATSSAEFGRTGTRHTRASAVRRAVDGLDDLEGR